MSDCIEKEKLKRILDNFFKDVDIDGRGIAYHLYDSDIYDLYEELGLYRVKW